jgi:hypothetical protein
MTIVHADDHRGSGKKKHGHPSPALREREGPIAKQWEGEGTAATVSIACRIEYQRKGVRSFPAGIAQPPPLNQSFKIG